MAALVLASCMAPVIKDPQVTQNLAPLVGPDSPLHIGERIAFLGDSITKFGERTQGYVWLIEQELAAKQASKAVDLIKAGIGGNKVTDLQQRLDRDVLSRNPTIVFVYIGINDVWHWDSGHGTTKADFEAGLRDVIQRIQDQAAVVVLATPSVIGEKADGSNKHDADLDAYAAISRKVAQEKGVVLCDLRKTFLAYLKEYNTDLKLGSGILTVDGVHLSDRGNRLVANCATASLAQALRQVGDRRGQ
jgi:lysophospholipase L1-like esterase